MAGVLVSVSAMMLLTPTIDLATANAGVDVGISIVSHDPAAHSAVGSFLSGYKKWPPIYMNLTKYRVPVSIETT